MKTTNYFLIIVLLSFFFTGCEDIFDENTTTEEQFSPSDPTNEGNLLIINQSNSRLVLFRGEEQVAVIPNSIEDFLVEVPNPDGNTVDLIVRKVSDDQMEEDIFKRWAVPLASDMEIEHRATWLIQKDNSENASGTITLTYSGGTENFAEVYLNYRNGPKLATLYPGTNFRTFVGIDYGNYTLHYRYFYSDPNTAESVDELGWVDHNVISGAEENIWAVLNQFRPVKDVIVPHWQGDATAEDRWGTLRVFNQLNHPIMIKANGNLIERVMFEGDEPVQNASTVPGDDAQEYLLPVDEYNFTAKHPNGNELISTTNDSIVANETLQWRIE